MRPGFLRATVAALAAALLSATPLFAGNIVLIGHEDGLRGFLGSAPASTQLAAMVAFARSRSTQAVRPFLAEDENGGGAGCEGCDLIDADAARVDATSAAIARFFDVGGGIVGLSGDGYEQRRWHRGRDHSDGFTYVRTACGAEVGIPTVDGDQTHNFFAEPDAGDVDPAYCVAERLGDRNARVYETIAVPWMRIGRGRRPTLMAVPEPTSLTLLGLGLAGAIGCRLRRS
jgi:hypothetical protein